MSSSTDDPWNGLSADCGAQQTRLEQQIEAWVSAYRREDGRIFCRSGCANCCTLTVHSTFIEACAVAEQLDSSQLETLEQYLARLRRQLPELTSLKSYLKLHRRAAGPCPFLAASGACGIYSIRPMACRALLATRPADWCAVDFAALDPWDLKTFQTGLDTQVVAWPSHYVAKTQEWARQAEDRLQDEMAARFGCTLSGNLPLLVWLQHKHRLDQLISEDSGAAQSLLESCDLHHPLLLEFSLRRAESSPSAVCG